MNYALCYIFDLINTTGNCFDPQASNATHHQFLEPQFSLRPQEALFHLLALWKVSPKESTAKLKKIKSVNMK